MQARYWSLTEVKDFIYFVPHYVVHPITFPCLMHSLLGTEDAEFVTVLIFFQLIDYRSSFGIVLGGNSVRLQQCFLDYLKQERSFLTSLIDNYTETLQVGRSSNLERNRMR